MIFCESDCWQLSGLPLDSIKREFITMTFRGVTDFKVRVATVGEGPTLLLCHDFMTAASIEWYDYIAPLSEHFKLVMPDLGTYGANSRF